MRILIDGDDEAAFRLAEGLMKDHEVHLLVPPAAAGPRLERLDVQVVTGSGTSTPALKKARVEDTALFVACTTRDEENIVACVNARRLGARRTICFLFRPDFDSQGDDEVSLAETLGIDSVVRPARQLAEEILRIVRTPGALDVEAFVGGRVHLFRHAVEEGAPITKGMLKELGVPVGTVLVMARRGEESFLPKGDTRFQVGDKLTVMGTTEGIDTLLHKYLRAPGRGHEARQATIAGGGTVGLAVAQGLEHGGWRVRVIETNRDRCEEIAPLLKGLVLHGDAADLDLLEGERVGDDPVLVAVTSNDEKNLLVSLLAKQLGVGRIVTRADTHANERLFERVGIDVVLSARGAAIQSVLSSLAPSRAELLGEVEHGEAEVLELTLPEDVPPIPLSRLKSDVFAIIAAILRDGRVIIPRGGDSVQGRDRILVFCAKEEEDQVRDFFLNRIHRMGA